MYRYIHSCVITTVDSISQILIFYIITYNYLLAIQISELNVKPEKYHKNSDKHEQYLNQKIPI